MSLWTAEPVRSLYVHVPFCAQKCEYCAFYSQAPSGEVVSRYVAALLQELELVAHDLHPHTVFFGGGTPSLLTLKQWEQILLRMDHLKLLGSQEWTVECNPATVSLEKARLLRSFGVNRISMGVQSLDARLLERLGRVHTRAMVFKSFDTLRAAGFENINLDLMFAIPGQTMEIWRATLEEALHLGSEHLSCYEVIYEEDTPLYAQLQAGQFDADENLACDMFEELVSFVGERGFHQYEIANFAKHIGAEPFEIPDGACRHNVNYWRAGSFYGLGPSATCYVRGVRAKNWPNTTLYCEQLERGVRAIESREQLSPLARAGETAAFGLRMNAGWPFALFTAVTGFDLRQEWAADLEELVANGLGEIGAERFRLTTQGLRLADSVGMQFLRTDVAEDHRQGAAVKRSHRALVSAQRANA
ncbi:MAG: radical SAM family heme chaperone HemW [Verrucomicrobiales bacterium]|nr:radical SAM family heme chaperone HemW [Verrucomicrobiales bacterium]